LKARRLASTRRGIAFFLCCLASLLSLPRASAQGADVAIVVNPESPVTNVSLADLRKIFAGEKRSWPGGAPVKLIVRGPGCHERLVLLRLMGVSESEYKKYWTAQVLRGEADAEPLAVPSFGMVKEAVKVFPGGIGMVNALDAKVGMHVIKVDGHLPGEAGYPVH
jgi:hypothetical protein